MRCAPLQVRRTAQKVPKKNCILLRSARDVHDRDCVIPIRDYDDPNEGKYTVGIIAEIPSGKIADFKVVLSPDEK